MCSEWLAFKQKRTTYNQHIGWQFPLTAITLFQHQVAHDCIDPTVKDSECLSQVPWRSGEPLTNRNVQQDLRKWSNGGSEREGTHKQKSCLEWTRGAVLKRALFKDGAHLNMLDLLCAHSWIISLLKRWDNQIKAPRSTSSIGSYRPALWGRWKWRIWIWGDLGAQMKRFNTKYCLKALNSSVYDDSIAMI